MLKTVGAILLLAGTTGLGLILRRDLEQYTGELIQFRNIFSMILNDMVHRKDTTERICLRLSKRLMEPYSTMLQTISQVMEADREMSFDAAWRKEAGIVTEKLGIKPKEKECIVQAFIQPDTGDTTLLSIQLQTVIDTLDYTIEKLRPEYEKKAKLSLYLCITCGVTGVVIFL